MATFFEIKNPTKATVVLSPLTLITLGDGRHDTQHNDTQHIRVNCDTEHNETQQKHKALLR